MKWLLEGKDVFKESLFELENEIVSQGMEFKIANYIPFKGPEPDLTTLFSPQDCVVFYGSLSLARDVLKTSWIPGVWCNLAHLECTHYYNYLSEFLLNDKYIMLPWGELIRQKEFLLDTLGNNGCIFVRPSSGFKLFSGNIISGERYATEIASLSMTEIDKSKIVVVSEPKNLLEEWRLIVVDKEIVAFSQYMYSGNLCVKKDCPQEVLDFGDKVCKTWQPEMAFTLDVCRTIEGDLRLLEINSFSCSGFYACNKSAIVSAVSKAALKEYEDVLG